MEKVRLQQNLARTHPLACGGFAAGFSRLRENRTSKNKKYLRIEKSFGGIFVCKFGMYDYFVAVSFAFAIAFSVSAFVYMLRRNVQPRLSISEPKRSESR